MPPDVVTRTSTAPDPVGDVAVIVVAEFTVNDAAGVDPNVTAVAPVRPVPVTVTDVPPACGPEPGDNPDTVVEFPPDGGRGCLGVDHAAWAVS